MDTFTKRRVRKGMSRRELARLAGCSDVHLMLVERGQRPLSDKVARKLDQALRRSQATGK